MTTKQLQQWYDKLKLEERFEVQRFLIKLYIMEVNNDKRNLV